MSNSLWFESALMPDGWADGVRIVTRGGRIHSIDVSVEPQAGDERHALAVPGMHNVHSHAFQRGFAGLAERGGGDDDNFWTWRETMYRFVGGVDPDDVEAIAALAYVEMIEAGFTRVGEFHYLHHDRDGRPYSNVGELASRIVAAADESGIGLTLLPSFYAHGTTGGAPFEQGQRRFINTVDGYAKLIEACKQAIAQIDAANLGIAPHSLRAATLEEIEQILPLAGGGPIHIHMAEQTKEVDDCIATLGRRPLQLLLDSLPVDERWCIIHGTHITSEEMRQFAATRAVVGLCPITEANLGDGIFPAVEYLRSEGRFGIGTDSNVRIDVAAELCMLEYGQRLLHRKRNVLSSKACSSTGTRLLEAALTGGGQALLDQPAGFSVGTFADIVSLDRNDPACPSNGAPAALDSWIFVAGNRMVDCVWCCGKKVVAGGWHHKHAAIERRFRKVRDRLMIE